MYIYMIYVCVYTVYLEDEPLFLGSVGGRTCSIQPPNGRMADAVEAGTSPEAESDLGLQAPWLVLCKLKPQPPPACFICLLCATSKGSNTVLFDSFSMVSKKSGSREWSVFPEGNFLQRLSKARLPRISFQIC